MPLESVIEIANPGPTEPVSWPLSAAVGETATKHTAHAATIRETRMQFILR
jgi:hypothetical protein